MSFNDNVQIDTSSTSGGGGGRGPGGGVAVGGVGGVILLIIALLFGGGDIFGGSGSPGGQAAPQQQQQGSSEQFAKCKTGADANKYVECRVIATQNSVEAYWKKELPRYGQNYTKAQLVLYQGSTQSACGLASNAVGPFYCPTDQTVYIDASFFDELTNRFGADSGALAQEYVVAHEYGHHVQNLLGLLQNAQQDPQGAESGAVRTELMADCFAGLWAHSAANTKDANGTTYLKPLTQRDVQSALSAAAAVGDDRIQQKAQGRVTPESWTHGSSAERQKWFLTGYQSGDVNQCDTFNAASLG
jgi:predicted metalloprotease